MVSYYLWVDFHFLALQLRIIEENKIKMFKNTTSKKDSKIISYCILKQKETNEGKKHQICKYFTHTLFGGG